MNEADGTKNGLVQLVKDVPQALKLFLECYSVIIVGTYAILS